METPPPAIIQSDTDLVMGGGRLGERGPHLAASQPLPHRRAELVAEVVPETVIEEDLPKENRLNSELEIRGHHYRKQQQYRAGHKRERQLTDIDFEGILNLIGGCNKWQIFVYVIISIQQIPHAMFNLSVVYMMYQPDHWCQVPGFTEAEISGGGRDYTWQDILNSTVLFRKVNNKQRNTEWHDQCMHIDRDWETLKGLSWKELQELPPTTALKRCASWDYDLSVMEETVVTQWNRVCDDNWSRAHVHLSYSLGYLAGCLVGGYLSDRYGRRTAIFAFGMFSLFFASILPFCKEFAIFLFVRFFLAASNEAADLAAYVLCMEITGVKYRSVVGSSLHAPWALGYSILALVAYLCKSWKLIHGVTLFLHIIALCALYFLPESPRWLMIVNETDKAEVIIRQACHYNKSSLPSDLGLVRHAEKRKWMREHEKPHLAHLFRSRQLCIRNTILTFIWASTALVYYGLVIALSDQSSPGRSIFAGNFFLNNAIAGAIELPTLFVCVVLLKSGRKSSQMITLCGAGITLVIGLVAVLNRFTTISLVFMLLGKAFIQGAFNILYIFTSELNPTIVRNSAIGFSSMVSRMGSGASGYIAILSDVTLPIVPMLIFSILSLIAGSLVIFLPETQDLPLPDTIWDAVSMHTAHKPCLLAQEREPLQVQDSPYAPAPVTPLQSPEQEEEPSDDS